LQQYTGNILIIIFPVIYSILCVI